MDSKQRRSFRRAVRREVKRSQNNKEDMPPPEKKRPAKTGKEPTHSSQGTIGILLTILLGIPTVLRLRAHPTVSLSDPLNPDDVRSTPFIISNDGLLDLEKVNVACYVVRMEATGDNEESNVFSANYIMELPNLMIGEKETVPFFDGVNLHEPIKNADVALIVTFYPQYMPFWSKKRVFRFSTVRDSFGKLRMQEQPAGDLLNKMDRFK
jgi:hypothetical protein